MASVAGFCANPHTTRETDEVSATGGTDGIDLSEIDAVIERLDEIIEWALGRPSRIGYFAAMYRRVTVAVRDGIVGGAFEDGQRMAHLDHVFAMRFIDAFSSWRDGDTPSDSWAQVFEASGKRRLIIVQHLVLGMNAHINLDLGIAAAQVAPGDSIGALRNDFDRISDVLASLIDGFVADVGAVSPWIGLLDRIAGRTEEHLIRFSIDEARKQAWLFATRLAADDATEQAQRIVRADRTTAALGRVIERPGIVLPIGLLIIRARESNDIAGVINRLRS